MQSKKHETDKQRIAKELTSMATRSASLEDFGRRVFQQAMLRAARQLEKSTRDEPVSVPFDEEITITARYSVVKPNYSYIGIAFGLCLDFGVAGEVCYFQEAVDLSSDKEVAYTSHGSGKKKD